MAKKKKTDQTKAETDASAETSASADETNSGAADVQNDEFIEDLEDTGNELDREGSESLAAAFSDKDAVDSPETSRADVSAEDPEVDSDAAESVNLDNEEVSESSDTNESTKVDTPESDDVVIDAEPAQPDPADEAENVAEAEPVPETVPEPVTRASEPAPAPVQHVQKVGFGQLVAGGVVAAALGAGALYFAGGLNSGVDTSALEDALAAQAAEIDALKAELAAAQQATSDVSANVAALPVVDLSGLEGSVASLTEADGATQDELSSLAASLDETRTRLADLEVQPIPVAEIPKEATEAYERLLAEELAKIDGRFTEMQAAQAEQLATLEGEIRTRLTELEALQAQASATEEAALIAANKAAAQAAAARIAVALDSGEGFAEQIAVLKEKAGIDAPTPLGDLAADGVTTLSMLQESFPPLARNILSQVDRNAGVEGGGNPLTSILMNQLGARSLAPREGNDPDAILSRAEAALNSGELAATLTELEALPDEGQPIIADWVAQAKVLQDARVASDAITEELNQE